MQKVAYSVHGISLTHENSNMNSNLETVTLILRLTAQQQNIYSYHPYYERYMGEKSDLLLIHSFTPA